MAEREPPEAQEAPALQRGPDLAGPRAPTERFEVFRAQHQRGLQLQVKAWGADYETAYTITQDAFARLWESDILAASARSGTHYPRGYLYRTARNLWFEQFRRRRPRSLDASSSPGGEGTLGEQLPARTVAGPLEEASHAESLGRLRCGLESLPEADRRIIEMKFLQDSDYVQICEGLGLARGTARVRLHRALGKLRELMGDDPRLWAAEDKEHG